MFYFVDKDYLRHYICYYLGGFATVYYSETEDCWDIKLYVYDFHRVSV